MGLQTYMIKKIWDLVGIYYQLQNNNAMLFHRLSDGHVFLN